MKLLATLITLLFIASLSFGQANDIMTRKEGPKQISKKEKKKLEKRKKKEEKAYNGAINQDVFGDTNYDDRWGNREGSRSKEMLGRQRRTDEFGKPKDPFKKQTEAWSPRNGRVNKSIW